MTALSPTVLRSSKEIVFGADFYDAEKFERWNIINRVVPADDLRDEALAWAQRLAASPTAARAVPSREGDSR